MHRLCGQGLNPRRLLLRPSVLHTPPHPRPIGRQWPRAAPIQHTLSSRLSSTGGVTITGTSKGESQEYRYITFPNTQKGRKAEREAHDYWASFWRNVPQVNKPLEFKIYDGPNAEAPKVSSVTREGVIFTKGNRQGEKYWRLNNPISWSTRLRQVRGLVRKENFFPQGSRMKYWLYGGPSLPLSTKLQWLVSGRSPHPWSERSRWIRWPFYGLCVYLSIAAAIVVEKAEQAPITGRWRFMVVSRQQWEWVLTTFGGNFVTNMPDEIRKSKPPTRSQINEVGEIFKRLLEACGLGDTKWSLYIVNDKDQPNAAISPLGHVILWSAILKLISSDDELAAILGHELSHEVAEHSRERAGFSVLGLILNAVLLPMVIGAFFAPRLLLTATTLYTSNGLLKNYFSRRIEEEADYIGILLMAEAGFNPAATTSYWQKLLNFRRSSGLPLWNPPAFLVTHPKPRSRMIQSEDILPMVLRLTGKSVPSEEQGPYINEACYADTEFRWKEFLAANAQRRSLLPWLDRRKRSPHRDIVPR